MGTSELASLTAQGIIERNVSRNEILKGVRILAFTTGYAGARSPDGCSPATVRK